MWVVFVNPYPSQETQCKAATATLFPQRNIFSCLKSVTDGMAGHTCATEKTVTTPTHARTREGGRGRRGGVGGVVGGIIEGRPRSFWLRADRADLKGFQNGKSRTKWSDCFSVSMSTGQWICCVFNASVPIVLPSHSFLLKQKARTQYATWF